VHVPFCAAKCDYCAFYSEPDAAPELRRAYLEALRGEFAERAPACDVLQSVFIGGGTPSVLPEGELRELLRAVRDHFAAAPDAEFTVECNPESATPGKAGVLAELGVNRVSLGVQSFEESHRATLGRRGGLRNLDAALEALRDARLANIGFDLIYGVPGQTLRDWERDLSRACDCGIRHLSTYALTFEEGARLGARGLGPVDDELAVEMWDLAAEVAGAAGLRRYEVSNLAAPGRECRHNLEVWHGGVYLGCGPAASSFDGSLRWTNPAPLDAWLRRVAPTEDPLPDAARAAEILAFGCRTVEGWSGARFRERTGFDWLTLRGEALRELANDGLLEVTDERLRPTRRGLLFADLVAERLL